MAQAKVVTTQSDFSAGEIDVEAKRDNKNPVVAAGMRQLSNFRILNAKSVTNRPGRRALVKESDRVEEIVVAPGVTYYLAFPAGFLRVYNSVWTQVFSEARPWTGANAKDVVWAIYDKSIYITFAGMVPRVLTWDGATTWSAADYAELVIGNQKRTPFYRISPLGVTMAPSATTGVVTLTFSAGMNLTAGFIGTRMRYVGRQVLITAVGGATSATATVQEPLPPGVRLTFAAPPAVNFQIGDAVLGSVSNTRAIVVGFAGGGNTMDLQQTNLNGFTTADVVVGPNGQQGSVTASATLAPQAVTFWDDEVMNTLRGWPASVFSDQSRVGFCDFPGVPGGIAWSAVATPTDLNVGALAAQGFFEVVPGKRRVFYVVPGMDASEFVICDKGILYIQITPANPLKPGSVGFSTISEDECGQVQPRRVGEFIIYVAGGLTDVMVVKIFGAYTRAYKTECVNELSGHLFTTITSIGVMTAASSFSERYAFVVNADGSVVVGKYSLGKSNDLEGAIGWTPWTGGGTVKYVSCRGGVVLFTTSYAPNGITAFQLVEVMDDSRYLDASQLYNTQPAGLPIPGGKGPLWWMPGGTVDLMDGPLGTRSMGTYTVDADGFVIPQGHGGEDLASATLVVGQAWTATAEPFLPPVAGGPDVQQTLWKRRVFEFRAYVLSSSGFTIVNLWGGDVGPLLPAPGTVMKRFRIPAWMQGEDETQPPLLRNGSWKTRPAGLSWDPRNAIVKDTPGPLTIEQIAMEASV